MPSKKIKVLLATADKQTGATLKKGLAGAKFSVGIVDDGARALAAAVSTSPQVILIDTNIAIISARKLVEILRSNPKTKNLPTIFIVSHKEEIDTMMTYQDNFIVKPVDIDNLKDLILNQLEKVEHLDKVGSQTKKIEGSLSMISIVDMVQILSINNKTGTLEVKSAGMTGNVFFDSGALIDAAVGKIGGEKALYRILTWKTGSYSFTPGPLEVPVRIRNKTEPLLVESMRQTTELERLLDNFPPLDSNLAIRVDLSTLPKGLRPITQEVLLLLEFYSKVSDIVDNCSYPDFEVYRTLNTLLVKGIIDEVRRDYRTSGNTKPLLNLDKVLALKERLSAKSERVISSEFGKVLILPGSNRLLPTFVEGLKQLTGFSPTSDDPSATPLSRLGEVKLSDSVQLDFIGMSLDEMARPWWRAFDSGAVGGVILVDDDVLQAPGAILEAINYFTNEAGLEFVCAYIFPGTSRPGFEDKVREALQIDSEDKVFELNPESISGCDDILRALVMKVI
jgi:CheY-like chemotaxis protein